MIVFRNLSVKQVLALSESELKRENTKTLMQLRKWIGEQMLKISTVVDALQDDYEGVKILKLQKSKLATKRALIDRIKNGDSH